MRNSRRLVGWVVVACAVGTALGQTAPPAARPAAGAAANKAKASLEPLLQQATDALAAGQYAPARATFQDALALDPRNVQALHGIGVCMVAQKQVALAAQTFDKALTMTTTPDRALVINAAAAQMAVRTHMRAAKLVKDYLTAHKEPDEQMLNALGTALSAATMTERKNRFFNDCAAFYMLANTRLEGERPGYKRFGDGWYPAAEAEARLRAMADLQGQLDLLMEHVQSAQDRFDQAQREYDRQRYIVSRGGSPNDYYYVEAQYAYDNAKTRLEQAAEKYDAATAKVNTPHFPTEIQMVAMGSLTPPPLSEPVVAIASATPAPRPRVRIRITGPAEGGTPGTGTGTTATGAGTTTTGGGGAGAGKTTVATVPPITLEPPKPTAPRKVRITQYAAAFPIASDLVVTSAAIVEEGASLQLQATDGQSIAAELVRRDEKSGLALLRVTGRKLNALALADGFAGGAVTCASFPAVDLFSPAAQSIGGSAPAPKGDVWTISLNTHPRLSGAPVVAGGKVVGVCIAARDAERAKLPATTLEQLKAFLGSDAAPGKLGGDPAACLLQLVTTRETMGE